MACAPPPHWWITYAALLTCSSCPACHDLHRRSPEGGSGSQNAVLVKCSKAASSPHYSCSQGNFCISLSSSWPPATLSPLALQYPSSPFRVLGRRNLIRNLPSTHTYPPFPSASTTHCGDAFSSWVLALVNSTEDHQPTCEAGWGALAEQTSCRDRFLFTPSCSPCSSISSPQPSHQMHVRYKVSQDGSGDSKSPYPVGLFPENPHAEIILHLVPALLFHAPAGQFILPVLVRVRRRRQEGPESQRQKYLDKHKGTEDLESVSQPNGFTDSLQKERKGYWEEAAAASHDAICQAQATFEVMTKNYQRGLESKGAATSKEDPVGEVADFKGPIGKNKSALLNSTSLL